ncbi:MAG: hypothetical protein RRY07_04365 [Bacteroidaceae bacterium]
MKKVLFCLLAVFVLASCGNANKNKQTEKEKTKLETAVSNAENAEITETEIFLGFRFGMSEKQVDSLFTELFKAKKIYANRDGSYQCDFNTESYDFNINFMPKYYNGELYEMLYPLTNTLMPSSNDYVFMALPFIRSERGKSFDKFTTKDVLGDEIYTNIKGNLIVSFYSGAKAMMKYSNAPIAKIVSNQEKQKQQDKANESSQNF